MLVLVTSMLQVFAQKETPLLRLPKMPLELGLLFRLMFKRKQICVGSYTDMRTQISGLKD